MRAIAAPLAMTAAVRVTVVAPKRNGVRVGQVVAANAAATTRNCIAAILRRGAAGGYPNTTREPLLKVISCGAPGSIAAVWNDIV